jgi:hypothetical protein
MSVLASGLVLAWICVVLLAFGLAGLLRQVSDLKADLVELAAQGPSPLRGRRVPELAGAATLVVDPGCGLCTPTVQVFAELAAARPESRLEVLSYRRSPDWPAIPVRIDEPLYRRLDVPWTPALVVVDAAGVVTSARPVTSPDELRARLAGLAQATEAAG